MTTSDTIATIGVTLMLVPFILNVVDKLSNDSPFYIVLNLIGGMLTCIASIMMNFLPFVILEGTWTLISAWALYVYFKRDFKRRES